MLKDLLNRLKAGLRDDDALPADDARIAVAALLVGAARADGHYAEAEAQLIAALLAQRYGLASAAAAALRAEGETAEAAAHDVFRFTRLVKASVPYEERGAVMADLWRVVLVDGAREDHEDALMRKIADLLGLSPMEAAQARQLARQQAQPGG